MRKKLLAFGMLMIFGHLLSGHEFWLQPQHYKFRVGQIVNLRFQAGENFEGENWKGNRSSVQHIRLHFDDISDNIENLLSDSTSGDSLEVQFYDEGTVMVTCQTENKFIILDSAKFLGYLKEDGLDEIIRWREENKETDSSGRELYQRNVKSLLQIGQQVDSTYKTETDLPVDIIPLSHPYLVKKKQPFRAKVLFQGEPLANQKVRVWNRFRDSTTKKELITNQKGIIETELNPRGHWMISTVKMIRLENDSTANWQSYWGSLTWGYY